MVSSRSRFLTLAAFAVALSGVPAAAQNGGISGVVRDARGLPMAGATVTVTNQATSASSRATTAADGRYAVSGLAAGAYTVAASLPGVRRQAYRDVQVVADATVSLDFALQPLVLYAITVTAMLREQELIDVPFSIAAPTEEALRLRGADNIEAIAENVAGFSVQNLGPGQSQVAMRGASSGQIARDQVPLLGSDVGTGLLRSDYHRVAEGLFAKGLAVRHNGDAQRALLDYFANVRTIRLDFPASDRCSVLLLQAHPKRIPAVGSEWSEIWRGSRPGDRNELFILYRR